MLIESKEKLGCFLAKAHTGILKVISRESNARSIECLIVNMRGALKSRHYWQDAGSKEESMLLHRPVNQPRQHLAELFYVHLTKALLFRIINKSVGLGD